MAKANRGSSQAKKEAKKVASAQDKKKEAEKAAAEAKKKAAEQAAEEQEQNFPDGGEEVDQPAFGVSVDAAPQTVVEIPPDPPVSEEPPADFFDFGFRTEPFNDKVLVIVTRLDTGEERSYRKDTQEEADKYVTECQSRLEAKKAAHQKQLELEKEAKIKPHVTPGGQLVSFQPEKEEPLNIPPDPTVPIPPTAAPNTPDELVLFARYNKENLHVIPELATLVKSWLGREGLDKFRQDDKEGLILLSYPSGRKAVFSVINGKGHIARA